MSLEMQTLTTHYIQDDDALVALCQQLEKSPLLAIDTEFVRTRTLYPKLGLLQVNDGKNLALIDPVTISDLSPFWRLLTNDKIVKVLHACSEDLEVFLTSSTAAVNRAKPENLIDSQIMMSFLGHGLSIGYAGMIKHFLDIDVDKSESRTDWTKRPLTENQLRYARADVDHLFAIYPKLLAQLTQKGWLEAAKQETQLLIEQKYRPIDDSQLYKKIKMAWRLNPKQLNLLKHLTAWRYQQAKSRNLPLGFVVKDHTLMAVASHNPQSMSVMNNLEGAEVLDIKHKGKAMLSVLTKANLDEVNTYPAKILRLDEYPGYKQTFKKVKDFIVEKAQQSELTVEVLASKKQINQFLSGYYFIHDKDSHEKDINDNLTNGKAEPNVVDILSGWRLELFGQLLQSFANNDFKA